MLSSIKGGTFFFFAGCTIVMFVWVGIYVPETKGKTLERMGEAFRHRKPGCGVGRGDEEESGGEERAV